MGRLPEPLRSDSQGSLLGMTTAGTEGWPLYNYLQRPRILNMEGIQLLVYAN